MQFPLNKVCKGPGPLKYIIQDVACQGLQAVPEANSRSACEDWCCDSEACLSWVFSDGPRPTGGCWAGGETCKGPHEKEWSGSSKVRKS